MALPPSALVLPHYRQVDFTGGMNYLDDATKIGEDEYPLLRNARHRNNRISPVKQHKPLVGLPVGKMQGIYDAGSYLFVFVSGKAYYKNYALNTIWTAVVDFTMDPNVDRIYAVLVDASTVNFKRELSDTPRNSPVNLTSTIGGSPKCAVVQDGINQPWVILSDGSSRPIQTFAQWKDSFREYVPIGTIMFYSDGILYVAGSNGAIYRSVTGRPLDFMVNITTTGEKGGPTEEKGGAPSVAHRVDFDTITAFSQVPTNTDFPGGFMVSTINNSYIVVPDFVNTIFGEPQFRNIWLFSTGPVNDFSITDTVSDIVFVDRNGLRSFNSIRQFRIEGQNSPFSKTISALFPTLQTVSAAINFDNYALFGMNTVFGPAIVVFDTLTGKFVAIDQQDGVGLVKQWAEVKTPTGRHLFFITQDDMIFEAYNDTVTATAALYVGEWTTNEPQELQQNKSFRAVFSDVEEDGVVNVQVFVDRVMGELLSKDLEQTFIPQAGHFPFTGTYNVDGGATVLTFTPTKARVGWKIGFLLSWNCQANLLQLVVDSDLNTSPVSALNRAKVWRSP